MPRRDSPTPSTRLQPMLRGSELTSSEGFFSNSSPASAPSTAPMMVPMPGMMYVPIAAPSAA